MFYNRIGFMDFIEAMLLASDATHMEEARQIIFPRLATAAKFVTAFGAKTKSAAAVGAESISAAEGRDINMDPDDEEEEEATLEGVGNATAAAFEEFNKSFSATRQLLSTILAKTHTGVFDAEFLQIANAEVANAGFCFAWAELFKGSFQNISSESR